MEEFAIDRLLGLDVYGIPLRPWYLAGHPCHAAADDSIPGCCASLECSYAPVGHSPTEFSAALSWGEVAEVVEIYEHEHRAAETGESPEPRDSGDFGIPGPPGAHEIGGDDGGSEGPDDD